MSNRFANGRKAFGFCDVCGFRFDLKRLKNLVVKTKETQIKACPQCWTPDQPQLQLGMYPISDPQALRNPRPDTNTWYQSGTNGLQTSLSSGLLPVNPFTADGTAIILVNAPNHGALTGTYVTFAGATVFSGVVIVGQYQLTVVNANAYTITYTAPVPAGNGGGSSVTFAYQPAAGVLQQGYPSEGMLVIQWGWNPIGGARDFDAVLTPNTLVGVGQVGEVTIGSTGTPAFTLVEVLYTTPGTYNWTAPAGITSIYVLCIGGGGLGVQSTPFATSSYFDSASLATGFVAGPGQRGTAFSGGTGGGGPGDSTFLGGSIYGGNGGNGAARSTSTQPGGGGGAGGYLGNGGRGGNAVTPFTAGTGGGGAGGTYISGTDALSGGGVGVAGQGSSGTVPGQGGSGGTDGTTTTPGLYGAGGRGLFALLASGGGGGGALRWTPNRVVTPLTTYALRVGAGGGTGISQGGSGAVKIAYWQPVS